MFFQMSKVNFNKADFVKSAASSKDFIYTSRPVIAFAGKSNVGKSSVINRILNRKSMAKVGNTPGKTVHVNYFNIDDKIFFADLPGYGFAKVSKQEKERWSVLMQSFFDSADLFSLGILIVDSRHKPTADDVQMCSLFLESGKDFIVVANKCDKLKKSEIEAAPAVIRDTLCLPDNIELILFSAETGYNRDILINTVTKYV